MGLPIPSQTLADRANLLRESLHKSQTVTDNMVAILGSFDHRLSALESAMRPTQVRTHAIRSAHENIDRTVKSADVILGQFDLTRQAEAKILKGPHEDLESYLEAIDQLRANVKFFNSNKSFKSSDGVLSHANSLLTKAIMKLEDEFRQILASYSKPVEPDRLFECLPDSLRPSVEADGAKNSLDAKSLETAKYKPPTLIPPRILPLLHDLAQQMVLAGSQQQCLKIYRETRASALELSLRKLGVERLGKDDVQKMQWEVLEAKIGNWIHFMRIAVKLLFAAERKICDQIFEGINNVLKDQCFAEVTSNSLLMLLSFGDAIAKSKRSSEKLFVLLDRYEIMRELQPEIVTIFDGRACPEMREASLGLTKRLAQTAQETFGDFVEAVEKDATKTAVQDGTVHPLTSYVILYILLCGVPPFWAESELGVAQAILRGFVDFKHEPWPSVSVSAKNLVKQMLEPDPKLRLTAKQVLEHPWLHNAKMAPNVPLVDAVKSRLKQFSVMNRFKRRALRVIADHLSIDEVEDIKEIFKKIDKDNDGSVSCTELKTGLTKHGSHLAESEVRMLIEAVVTSGKGTLDYAESLGISLHLLKMAKEEHLRRTFSYFDKDGNGYIEAEELQEALAEDGAADSRGAANDVLQEVDTDKDGRISYEEIVAMMKTGTDEASNGVLVQC